MRSRVFGIAAACALAWSGPLWADPAADNNDVAGEGSAGDVLGNTVGELSQLGLGPVVGMDVMVADIDKAAPVLEAIFGPLTPTKIEKSSESTMFRGKPANLVLKHRDVTVGDLYLGFNQVIAGDFYHSEFAAKHGSGINILVFQPADPEAALQRLVGRGFTIVQSGPNGCHHLLTPPANTIGDINVAIMACSREAINRAKQSDRQREGE